MIFCLQDRASLDQWFSALAGYTLESPGELTNVMTADPTSEILIQLLWVEPRHRIFLKLPR